MPLRITWLVPDKVVSLELLEFVSRADALELGEQIGARLDESSNPPVHVVVDYSAATYIPTNLGFLSHIARPIKASSRMGYALILSNRSPLMATIATLVCQMVGIDARTVKSTDEALAFLKTHDPALAAKLDADPSDADLLNTDSDTGSDSDG